jgi:hypothetical protein
MGDKAARREQRPVRSAQTVVVEDETKSKRIHCQRSDRYTLAATKRACG